MRGADCKLDKPFRLRGQKQHPFEPCTSPYTTTVGRGRWFFDVRAIDRNDNADPHTGHAHVEGEEEAVAAASGEDASAN